MSDESTSQPKSRICNCVTGCVQHGPQVTGLLLGLVREKCAALTADLTARAIALAERPADLQPYMQLQVWLLPLC